MKFYCCCCLSSGLLGVNNSTRETPQIASAELCFVAPSPIDPANEKKIEESLTSREASPGAGNGKIIMFRNQFAEDEPDPTKSGIKEENSKIFDNRSESPPPPPPPRLKLNLFPLPEDSNDDHPHSPAPANNIFGSGFMSIRGLSQISSSNSESINRSQSLPAVEISSVPNQRDKFIQNDSENSSVNLEPSSSPRANSGDGERNVRYINI